MTPLDDERMTPKSDSPVNRENAATRGATPESGIVTRFAPSPTGLLHLGHALSAWAAFEAVGRDPARFRLRIEDIDEGRSRPEFVTAILEDLAWMGIGWAEPPMLQSERRDAYAAALERLKAMGAVYPCFCTRADIAAAGSAPHGPDGPLYPGTCRHLPPAERAARLEEPHAWRLDSAKAAGMAGALTFETDGARVPVDPGLLGDVVVARKDAGTSYHLASVVDDAAQGVGLVVRGRDLLASTHVHRLLQALLELPTPIYRHHALLLGEDGEKLSKRHVAKAIRAYRKEGWSADDLRDHAFTAAGRLA